MECSESIDVTEAGEGGVRGGEAGGGVRFDGRRLWRCLWCVFLVGGVCVLFGVCF